MRNKFFVLLYVQWSIGLVYVSLANLEMTYSVTFENSCRAEKDRFQFITGTSIAHCVNECGARQHCLALNFRTKMNVCELFSTSKGQISNGDCIHVEKSDIRVTKTPCPSVCKDGTVCEKSHSGVGKCKVKECIKTPVIENGTVLGNRRDVGAIIRFKCDYGYKSNGVTVAECLDTGNWSTYAAECIKVTCESKTSTSSIAVESSGTAVGDTLNATCKSGYRRVGGSMKRTCTKDGTWSNTELLCEVTCETKYNTSSIAVKSSGTGVGDTLSATCKSGYRRVSGSTKRTCTKDGTWSNTELICEAAVIYKPDFESTWYKMTAQAGRTTTLKSVAHGLGETPLLVDVQVKVTDGDYADYIFPATGCPPRDDDEPEGFGGISYIYNHEFVQVSSPTEHNQKKNRGRCVYTGVSPFWEGPYNTTSYNAQVRVRAWKKSTLPAPSYSATSIPITGGNTTGSYVERSHGIGDYPTLVISRTKFPSSTAKYPDYYSDSIGAAPVVYNTTGLKHRRNAYVIYGYNTSTIRAWAPSAPRDGIFDGTDGWNFVNVSRGELEFYAWDETLLFPTETENLTLGPSVSGSKLQQPISKIVDVENAFTRAWVQASAGSNSGFRFVGSGSLAYDDSANDAGCTYGGLLYAYAEGSIRYWQPGAGNGNSNGALICIPNKMGDGSNVQASSDGQAMYSSWEVIGKN